MKIKSLYKGISFTFLASLFWGIPQPIFFNEIKFIPAIEIAFHRGFWSFLFLLIIVTSLGRIKYFIKIFLSFKNILILSITSILITTNWLGFIFAISINRLQDASLGYYMTPLISIILGFFFLNEKITFLKLISIIMMFFSILYLILSFKIIPFLAILIGLSWSIYGLLRKKVAVSSEIGLLFESGLITLFALPYLIYINYQGVGFFLNHTNTISIFLILTGMITVIPLFFFNSGIKFITLGFAGVIFFIAPSLHFVTSIFILNETLSYQKLNAFIIIWLAVIIFIIDIFREERKIIENKTRLPN